MDLLGKFWTFKKTNKVKGQRETSSLSASDWDLKTLKPIEILGQKDYPNQNIQKYGCLFLCILYVVNPKLLTRENVPVVKDIYDLCNARMWMRQDCYILDRIAIIEFLKKYYSSNSTTGLTNDNIVKNLIRYSLQYDHFVVAKNGNILYDPMNKGVING